MAGWTNKWKCSLLESSVFLNLTRYWKQPLLIEGEFFLSSYGLKRTQDVWHILQIQIVDDDWMDHAGQGKTPAWVLMVNTNNCAQRRHKELPYKGAEWGQGKCFGVPGYGGAQEKGTFLIGSVWLYRTPFSDQEAVEGGAGAERGSCHLSFRCY